jgi:hypothetical protein
MTLNLKKMMIEEKLKIMEMLWDDICQQVPDFSSPEWHAKILKDRENKLQDGKEKILEWIQAKADIRKSL